MIGWKCCFIILSISIMSSLVAIPCLASDYHCVAEKVIEKKLDFYPKQIGHTCRFTWVSPMPWPFGDSWKCTDLFMSHNYLWVFSITTRIQLVNWLKKVTTKCYLKNLPKLKLSSYSDIASITRPTVTNSNLGQSNQNDHNAGNRANPSSKNKRLRTSS